MKDIRYGSWSLFKEKQRGVERLVIKRWANYPDGKRVIERMPTSRYEHFRDNPEDLARFVLRENETLRAEQRVRDGVELRHAFIDDELIEKYRKRRSREVPSQDRVSTEIYYLKHHFLGFFINKMNLKVPQDWHRTHRDEWADYLMSKDVPPAPATKREIIQTANRFMAWLHTERPTEVPEMRFKPLSTMRFKDMVARREIDPNVKKRTYIKPEDWKIIVKNLTRELEPFVMIAYNYGARRSETLGFKPGDVKKGHLCLHRQLEFLEPEVSFKPNKGKEKRECPHWYSTAAQAYEWVEACMKYRIDPDALTDLWNEVMVTLGMEYDFHDLRHSFITRAIRDYKPRDVQLAAGHKHLKTTMGYAHDDREMANDDFIPGETG